jgi:hypothetical protein
MSYKMFGEARSLEWFCGQHGGMTKVVCGDDVNVLTVM